MLSIGLRSDIYTLAAQLSLLYDLDATIGPKQDPRTIFSGSLGQYGQYTQANIPAFAWYTDGQQMVIIITGATIPAQGVGLLQGALLPLATRAGARVNSFCLPPVDVIKSTLGAKGIFLPPSVVIIGHSYGGAIAEVLLADLASGSTGTAFQLLTLGAPRAGDISLTAAIAPWPQLRIFNYDDTVPFFPPHFDEAPIGTIAIGFAAAYQLSQYVQTGGGASLTFDGLLVPATLPTIIAPIADVTLLAWALDANAFLSNGHFYRTYLQRLGMFNQPIPGPQVGFPAGLKGEFEPALTPQIFNLGPVAGPAAMNGADLVATISVYIPVVHRAKSMKVGNVYVVIWEGQTVAQGQTKSNAKTLAKYINKWLRVQQTVNTVYRTPFTNAFNNYILAAGSPSGGFMPVLNVV
jgi:pimeloyl-ACP methyl ester carboxylesterase